MLAKLLTFGSVLFALQLVSASVSMQKNLGGDLEEGNQRMMVLLRKGVSPEALDFHEEFATRAASNFFNEDEDDNEADQEPQWFSFNEDGDDVIGYSSYLDTDDVRILSKLDSVDLIEEDKPVYAMPYWRNRGEDSFLTKKHKDGKHHKGKGDKRSTEKKAPWGLARITSHDLPKKNSYHYYKTDGSNVDVYVVDTGIRTTHKDFSGRAIFSKSMISDPRSGKEVKIDDVGHGTHCAGTIAGDEYGVCKNCTVHAVKVLDGRGSGSMSGVIAGIEWVVKNARKTERKSVISMSLGGGFSQIMNRAANAAVRAGIFVVVASGNEYSDSCMVSPSSAELVISVGASDNKDTMAYFSNYGKCTAIFAPGVNVESTYNTGDDSTAVLSGTSMATPHVAGVVGALLSRKEYRDLSPKEMKELLKSMATKDMITDIPASAKMDNDLLYMKK